MSAKILLVDDRKENLFSLSAVLETSEVEIFKCESGVQALSMMVDHDFALAILDVQMPEMDGFELAELIRGAEKTKNVPIIFITAATESSGFAFKGYERGAVDFLYKPVDPWVLKCKVQIFLDLHRQKELLKKQVEELRVSWAAANRANILKSAFLANMSHEIRTPLGVLLGFTSLLRDRTLNADEKTEYLDIMERNGQALGQLIDDILDLSKVEAGHLDVEKIEFDPMTLLRDVQLTLQNKADAKAIKFTVHGRSLPAKVCTDPTRLRQILVNIADNAIKFTEQGSVHVDSYVVPLEHGEVDWIFKVTDTGMGLSEEQASKLFQPFVQADNSTTRRFGGTGLGLALSRRLAHLMGGDVRLVKSEVGAGSEFEIHVRCKAGDEIVKDSEPNSRGDTNGLPLEGRLQGISILVVEDSPDNQYLLKRMLQEVGGAVIEFADNGDEGVQKALVGTHDILIMDIQMPVLDGFAATTLLRDRKFKKPILALTANAMREDRERCFAVGFSDYLMKPINQAELFEKVLKYTT